MSFSSPQARGVSAGYPFLASLIRGLGIAMVLPAWNSFMMCLGAGIAEWLRRTKGEKAADKKAGA